MKTILLLLTIIILIVAGCAEEAEEQPEIRYVIKESAVEEEVAEEEPEELTEEEPEEGDKDYKVFYITATQTSWEPSEIDVFYEDNVKLVVRSNYTHSFYAPTLHIYEKIEPGETVMIYMPTDRRGTHKFWCNMTHYGLEHRLMYGKFRVE
ncbi:cupredoxin domain-containing protein [Candidatus Woesearchaeota archaeon]|nr:cupredoxin domain-containing protein [Candidatus Woesearchaeota archaeon]